MIDRIVFLPSAVLGLCLAGIYGVRCWRNGHRFELASMVTLMLNAAGVIAGAVLVLSTFSERIRSHLAGIELYTLIGGLAVFAVSLQGVFRDLLNGAQDESRDRDG